MTATKLGDELSSFLRDWSARHGGRVPRLVLFGNYGQGNVGDEAILHAILGLIGAQAKVTVMSKEPERVRALHGVAAESALTVAGQRVLWRSNVVAIGGGGIFGNNMTLLPQLLPLLALVLRLSGKAIAFVAIGAYITTPPWLQRVLRLVVRNSALVTVRDEETLQVFASPKSILVDDPGMTIAPAPASEVDAFLAQIGVRGQQLLAISLKPAVDPVLDERQLSIARRAVQYWSQSYPDGEVLLLCFSERGNSGLHFARTDLDLSRTIAEDAPDAASVHIVGSEITPWLMKGVLARCSAVVAHRLHAQMFAYDSGVPMLGLSWERKSDVFLDAVGAIRIDLAQEVDPDELYEWLSRSGART